MKQDEFEDVIMDLAAEYFGEFVGSGGASALAQFTVEAGTVSTSEEAALKQRVIDDRAQMENLVDCLTPDLASTLGPKIKELKDRVEDGEARLRDIDEFRISQQQAEQWVAGLVQDASSLGDLMRSGTIAERRTILQGITQEIVFDPETRTGEVCFFAVPRVSGVGTGDEDGGSIEKRTPPDDDVLFVRVAGARATARETTDQLENWRKSFGIGSVRMAA